MPRPTTRTEFLEFQRSVLGVYTPTPEGRRDAGKYDDIYPDNRILATRGRWKLPQELPPEFNWCLLPATSTEFFTRDFNDNISDVTLYRSDPTVTQDNENQTYHLKNTNASETSSIIGFGVSNLTTAPSVADFILDVNLTIEVNETYGFRYRTRNWPIVSPDSQNWGYGMGYELQIQWSEFTSGGEFFYFFLVKNSPGILIPEGGFTQIASGQITPPPRGTTEYTFEFRLKIFGTTHILCVNGEHIFTITDTSFVDPGEFGFSIFPVHIIEDHDLDGGDLYVDNMVFYTYDGSDLP